MKTNTSRFNGKLKKWNVERGFGFVVAEHGEQEVFVHVSAFPRDGHQPVVGEPLSFEIEPDKDGRKRAVRVRRPGSAQPAPDARPRGQARASTSTRRPNGHTRSSGSSFGARIVGILLLAALGWWAYGQYRTPVAVRAAPVPSASQGLLGAETPQALTRPAPAPLFRCDGRQHCSQMSSCQEAKFFLQNCPDTKMDGDGDGIPCEQQLCTGAFGYSR